MRYKRFCQKYNNQLTLEQFLEEDDKLATKELQIEKEHWPLVRQKFYNKFDSAEEFHHDLEKFDFTDTEIIRPKYERYFMRMAMTAACRANCMKRAVGAIIIDSDKQIIATGYNGTPFGMKNCGDGGCPRCNSNAKQGMGLDRCVCIHAEENAVINAGRMRGKNCTLFVTTYPCVLCAKMIVQSGIEKVYYYKDYANEASKEFLKNAPIEIIQQDP